jgi:hypothetical protein
VTTKRQIIDMSYGAIGLAGYTFDLQPEQIEFARQMLDAMMAQWNAQGIRLGWPIPSGPTSGDVDEETYLPDSALSAVYLNLGTILASTHGKQVMPVYLAMSRAAKDAMFTQAVKPMARQMPGGYPLGSGHKTYWGASWSADPEPIISTGSNELEL